MSKPHDRHRLRAAKVFGIDPADVTDEQRKVGKRLNFVDLYSGHRDIPMPDDDIDELTRCGKD